MNGRLVDKFLQTDLKEIHILIESATVDDKPVDIVELNAVLAK